MSCWITHPGSPVRASEVTQFMALRSFVDSDVARVRLGCETSPGKFMRWLLMRAPFDCAHAAWISVQALSPNPEARIRVGDLLAAYRRCLERAIASFEERGLHEEFFPRFGRPPMYDTNDAHAHDA